VEKAHTFFVGQQQWLVHNSCAIQLPNIVKPKDLKGASYEQVSKKFSDLDIDLIAAKDGGAKWRWEENGEIYEVRYHNGANPNLKANQPGAGGSTIKFGQVVVGDGKGFISNTDWMAADELLVEAHGRAIGNRPPIKTRKNITSQSHRRSQYVDPWGVAYFTAENELGGRFANNTHILGAGNKLSK